MMPGRQSDYANSSGDQHNCCKDHKGKYDHVSYRIIAVIMMIEDLCIPLFHPDNQGGPATPTSTSKLKMRGAILLRLMRYCTTFIAIASS